jgi:hypothetical protein
MNKQEVIAEIQTTFSRLKAALSKFTEQELNMVPFAGSWTAGQVTEHIIKSIGGIPDERTKSADRPYDEKIEAIREMFLDMNQKFQTDPSLEPEGANYSLESLLDTLAQFETQHIATVQRVDLTALCLDMELPVFGYLTRYEWIRFMMVHTQRHTQQIENIYSVLRNK